MKLFYLLVYHMLCCFQQRVTWSNETVCRRLPDVYPLRNPARSDIFVFAYFCLLDYSVPISSPLLFLHIAMQQSEQCSVNRHLLTYLLTYLLSKRVQWRSQNKI